MAKPAVLQQNKDFRRLYGRGKSCVHAGLVTYAAKNRMGECRIGITTSKKIGNAVTRNRARRVIREAYRGLTPEGPGAYDVVFVARAKTARMKSTEVQRVMRAQLTQLGVLRPC